MKPTLSELLCNLSSIEIGYDIMISTGGFASVMACIVRCLFRNLVPDSDFGLQFAKFPIIVSDVHSCHSYPRL